MPLANTSDATVCAFPFSSKLIIATHDDIPAQEDTEMTGAGDDISIHDTFSYSLIFKVNYSCYHRCRTCICRIYDWICGWYFSFSSKLIIDEMIGPEAAKEIIAVDDFGDDGGFNDDDSVNGKYS